MSLEKKYNYVLEYKAKNIKRVPFDMQNSEYKRLKYAASKAGIGVNTYIKEAVRYRMDKEKIPQPEELPDD